MSAFRVIAGSAPFTQGDAVRQLTMPPVLCGGVHEEDHAIAAPSHFFDYGGWLPPFASRLNLANFARKRVAWEERHPRLVWRGSVIAEPPSRMALVNASMANADLFDAAATDLNSSASMSTDAQARYRFTGYTNGVADAIAYRLDQQLALGQVVLWAQNEHQAGQEHSWYSNYIVNGTHFLLARPNFDRVEEDLRRFMRNDALMRRIADKAAAFADAEFSDLCLRSYTATVVRAMHQRTYDANHLPVERWSCPSECSHFDVRTRTS